MQVREINHLIQLQHFLRPLKFELVSRKEMSDKLPVFLHMHENEQGNFMSHSAVKREKTKKPFICITMTEDI